MLVLIKIVSLKTLFEINYSTVKESEIIRALIWSILLEYFRLGVRL